MDRIEQLRQVIDDIVRKNPDPQEARSGFVHLYGVAEICTLLALKRGLDLQLCCVAGMLHDIWNYQVGDSPEHGKLGAGEAEKILVSLGSFSAQEISQVCQAIARHGDKETIDDDMAELLKDADVLQHYIYNPQLFVAKFGQPALANRPITTRMQRKERVLLELGIRGR